MIGRLAIAGVALLGASVGAVALVAPAPAPAPATLALNASPAVAPVVSAAARQWLERAARAPSRVGYRGTQYVTAWGRGGTSAGIVEVSHDPETGTTWRSAGGREQLRTGGSVTPSLGAVSGAALMARFYSLDLAAETAQVAGRSTAVVVAREPARVGRGRVVARFWVDRDSGLVLRREAYAPGGRPVRASAFVGVEIWPASPAAAGSSEAWSDTLSTEQVHRLRRQGWVCPRALPDHLALVDARRDPQRRTLHLSYADGLWAVSVFAQRGQLDPEAVSGYRREVVAGRAVWHRPGVPERVVWSADGVVYTVVADAPARTVDAAVRSLVLAGPRQTGPLARLGRGLDRVASWFNPTD